MLRTKFPKILLIIAAGWLGLATAPSVHAISSLSLSEGGQWGGLRRSTPTPTPVPHPTTTPTPAPSATPPATPPPATPPPSTPPPSHTSTLIVSDGTHALALTNASGGITYSGMLGNFSLNITSGQATGDALLPTLNVNSVGYSGRGTGTLTIVFSETSFGALAGSVASQISGLTAGTVSYSAFGDASNKLFGQGTLLGNAGLFSAGTFSGGASATYPVPGPFSLTEMIVISQNASGTTSFATSLTDPVNVAVSVPDSGSTVTLLALALLGIGLARRKLAAS
jgi:hypothetical protein